MKQFIKVHAISSDGTKRVELVITSTVGIVSIIPDDGFTNINYEKHGVRVTETIEELYDLIYPTPFITLFAVSKDLGDSIPREIIEVTLPIDQIKSIGLHMEDDQVGQTAIELSESVIYVRETRAEIKELIRNAI